MMKFKKILVAFDGSEHSLKALNTAKKIVIDNDANLTVIYVHESELAHPVKISTSQVGDQFMVRNQLGPGVAASNGPFVEDEKVDVILEDEVAGQVIELAKEKLRDLSRVTYEKIVGKPDKKIVSYAKYNDFDLIVIGHRGIGALEKMVMGSVSQKVLNNSECSVLVVK